MPYHCRIPVRYCLAYVRVCSGLRDRYRKLVLRTLRSLVGKYQTCVPVQLRHRCGSAMRGLGYGSRTESRRGALSLLVSHNQSLRLICPLFPNLCTSSALPNLSPRFLASGWSIVIRVDHARPVSHPCARYINPSALRRRRCGLPNAPNALAPNARTGIYQCFMYGRWMPQGFDGSAGLIPCKSPSYLLHILIMADLFFATCAELVRVLLIMTRAWKVHDALIKVVVNTLIELASKRGR